MKRGAEVDWKSVAGGIAVGIIVSWIPGMVVYMFKWYKARKERAALARIESDVNNNSSIAKEDRAKEILKRKLSYAMKNGWLPGGPFDPTTIGVAKLDGTIRDLEDAARNVVESVKDIGDSIGSTF
jgi:sulfite exporter TauE/SafE